MDVLSNARELFFQYPAVVAAVVPLHQRLGARQPHLGIRRLAHSRIPRATDGAPDIRSAGLAERRGPQTLSDLDLTDAICSLNDT